MPDQYSLFNSAQFATPAQKPGEMSADKWMETQNPKFHGSFRSDFGSAPVAHYGTMGQAVSRLHSAGQTIQDGGLSRDTYYNPSSALDQYGDDEVDRFEDSDDLETHTGRVYARRLDGLSSAQLTDSQANAAEMGYRYQNHEEEWEIPASVKTSAGQDAPELGWDPKGGDNPKAIHTNEMAEYGQKHLERGNNVRYRNPFEGNNPIDAEAGLSRMQSETSYIAPSGNATSWERDVINTPTASPMAQRFAQQRIKQGKEGAVPFPSYNVEQQTMQTQLPVYKDENERRDGSGVNVPGRWFDMVGGKSDRYPGGKRSTISQVQFEA